MRAWRTWSLLVAPAALASCAGTVVFVPGPGGEPHPADPAARVPAFRPAPDPLLVESPPGTQPDSTVPGEPAHAGHAPAGHEQHGVK